MIYANGTNSDIERHKARLGLVGDVYLVGNEIASLASHKRAFRESTATTIEEAELEKIADNAEKARLRAEMAAQLAEEELEGAEVDEN